MQIFVMKYVITYLFYLHSCNVAFAATDFSILINKTYHCENRFLKFPDNEGVEHTIDLEATQDLTFLNRAINYSINQYYLYTRENRWSFETIKMNDAQSVFDSKFNASNPTVVAVHGWTGNLESGVNIALRNAFLAKVNYNVIVVDWSRIAKLNYVTAVAGVPHVGQRLGQFLSFLISITGASLRSMHLIGHSLGAHVVGNAGRALGGRVARITGLDPAGPLWSLNSKRLTKSDAIYVEAIHTNSGTFGIIYSVATVDFYANGGMSQPGCDTDSCNHNRSWKLFAASVSFNHLFGHKCTDVLQLMLDTCLGDLLELGNASLNKSGSGVYRLNTKSVYPY